MKHAHIYCDVCHSVQPMVLHAIDGNDKSRRFDDAMDIMCGTCGLVITTIYRQQSSGAEALRRVMAQGSI